jgi:alpha-ribazole phosphatase/probable phosphoglycerate mutase
LVRHGETAWNAGLKFQGHTDVPLSQRGIEQAGSLARRLNNRKFTAFYASDLTRAIETAEIVAVPHGLAVKPVPALREVNFGSWEGLTFKEIKERFTELAQRWCDNPMDIPVPEGETLAELALRVNGAVRWILEHHLDGQEVVVVSHGGPIRIIIATMLGMDLNQYWRLRLDNACLNIIDFSSSDSGVLALFNDRSHLE